MSSRALRAVGPAILLLVAALVMIWALQLGGGAAERILADPGPVVRWGLPSVKLLVNLSAAGMIGTLVTALFALKPGTPAFATALDVASMSAAVFATFSAATGFLTFLNAFNPELGLGNEFGAQLGRFLIETEVGRAWLITTIAGALLTVLIFAVAGWTSTLCVALLAVATLVPMGTQGHAGDQANHNAAVTTLILHIIAAAVWLGGLGLIVAIRPLLDRTAIATALSRYSSIALVAFIVVALSGTVRAAAGLTAPRDLVSPYGAVLLTKVAALILIGVLAASYRTRLIRRIRQKQTSRTFWQLVAVEFAAMGVASGAAAALALTPPPVDTTIPLITPAAIYTGAELPPELTAQRWFSGWEIDWLWAFVVGFAVFFYLAGVWRLRRRGDRWSWYRVLAWLGGMAQLFWVTCGPINVYQDVLFSMHMLGHMLLTMSIPLMLVGGAPITLALRTIRKRDDDTRGGREWILWAVHSRAARVITHPFTAAGLFVGSLWVFYYTDLFRWSLYDHLGHEWMTAHFLITGYLFVQSLIGIDPVHYRVPYPFRLVMLVGVMAMHAFFGIGIMMQSGLMVAEWFGSMGRTWGLSPLEDQYLGGGVAWSIGEIPTLVLAIIVAIQWNRTDERAQRRRDRHVDRAGDDELDAYNQRLAAIAARDARERIP